jgi:Bifunctional DNA primase/polymerase, N-terminal
MKRRLMAAAALRLIERGFFVFPLRPGDKMPLPHFKHWEQRATRDQDRVYKWWSNAPYNIGVAAGPSQLLVVDCDTARGTAPPPQWSTARDGLDVLRQLAAEAGAGFPRTMAVRTPSGGIHLYFQAPQKHHLGNSAGRVGWHIDTRGIGGYVVGPGSVCSGRYYVVVDHAPIAPLPTWITALLVPRQPSGPPTAPTERITGHNLKAILQGEVERVRSARPGRRNHALNTAAFIMGQLVGSGEITEEHAWSLLRSASQRHIGVHGFTESELERTTRSGLSAGMRRPRWIHQQG